MLIVGLGNPGKKYEDTVHNMGFMTVDVLLDKLGAKLDKKGCEAEYCVQYIGEEKQIIAKPQTFMNLSGVSVKMLANSNKIPLENVIIIYDDIDLPLGNARVRKEGSGGSHNGMKNIIAHLGGQEFARLRIGVGEKPEKMDLADYVTGHFSKGEQGLMEEGYLAAVCASERIVSGNIGTAMNEYNQKKKEE